MYNIRDIITPDALELVDISPIWISINSLFKIHRLYDFASC